LPRCDHRRPTGPQATRRATSGTPPEGRRWELRPRPRSLLDADSDAVSSRSFGWAYPEGETPSTSHDGRCCRRCSQPATETDTRRPRPTSQWLATKPRSLASSHTVRRGHDVRQASMTSAYGRASGPIHSRRSRTRAPTVSDIPHHAIPTATTWISCRDIEQKLEGCGLLVLAVGRNVTVSTAFIQRPCLGLRRAGFESKAGVATVSRHVFQRVEDG